MTCFLPPTTPLTSPLVMCNAQNSHGEFTTRKKGGDLSLSLGLDINQQWEQTAVLEFIDPVFTKTSPKRSFSLNRKRAFWLVFAKTGSIISGSG
jgi:hypothetical protein